MELINVKNRNLEHGPSKLRSAGIIPGTLYGPTITNTAIEAKVLDIERATKTPGEIYEVSTSNGKRMVKFGEIQRDPVSNDFIHFSLVEMPKDTASEVEIPIDLKGTPVGVRKGGTLVVMKDEIMVSGKPKVIPKSLKANISKLDIGDRLTVDDLHTPAKIETVDDSAEVIAFCKAPTLNKAASAETETATSNADIDLTNEVDKRTTIGKVV